MGHLPDPADVLHVKRVIQTELLDDLGDVLGLLGGGDVGGGPPLRAEGHEDAEDQHGYAEQNENQEKASSGDEGGHGRSGGLEVAVPGPGKAVARLAGRIPNRPTGSPAAYSFQMSMSISFSSVSMALGTKPLTQSR